MDVDDYAAYGVPEIWLWKRQVLNIHGWIDGMYALMAIPTTVSAILLAPKVMEAARTYFAKLKTAEG